MAARFHERLAQARLKPRSTPARDWRAAFGDAAFRQRVHGVGLMIVAVVGLVTGLLVVELGYATVVGAGMGVYGLYLWRG